MTLSCRARAFSVDNLLRPSSNKVSAFAPTESASPSSSFALPPASDFGKFFANHRKSEKIVGTTATREYLAGENLAKTLQLVNSISRCSPMLLGGQENQNNHDNNNMKNRKMKYEFPINPDKITPDVQSFKRQYSTTCEDEIMSFYVDNKHFTDSDKYNAQRNELCRLPYAGGGKYSDVKPPADVPQSNKKSRSNRSSGISASCFCHGEMLFCNHPGIMSVPDLNGSESSLIVELCHADLWTSFHRLGTEMIITKSGRRMFPALKLRITGLYPDKQYIVRLEFQQSDMRKYRYIYHSSRWMVSGSGDTLSTPQSHMTPDGPISGQVICSQIVSFERLKLTNTDPSKAGQVSLVSMQKFQPQIVIQEVKNMDANDATQPEHYVIMFLQTSFMAVTAYQNQQITTLKIASNPFAKGFRDSGKARLSYESFMATIPRPVSCDATLDYLPGLVRPSGWSPAQWLPRDFNLSINKRCLNMGPNQDRCQYIEENVIPAKMMKIENGAPDTSLCSPGVSTSSFPSNPSMFAALQKPLAIPLPTHYNHPLNCQILQQQQKMHHQQQILLATTPQSLHPLLHYFPYSSDMSQSVPTTVADKLSSENYPRDAPPRNINQSVKPRPAHLPPHTTPLHPTKQLAIPVMTSKMRDSPRFPNIKTVMDTDNSNDFLNRQSDNIDSLSLNDSPQSSQSLQSLSEDRPTSGRSRSSQHSTSGSRGVQQPARCMTEPSEMAITGACCCLGCGYHAPSLCPT